MDKKLLKSLQYEYQTNRDFKNVWDESNLKREIIQNEIKDLESYANGQIKYNNVDPFDDEVIEVKNRINKLQNRINKLQKLINESEEK